MWREIINAIGGIFRNCKTKCKSSCCEINIDMQNDNSDNSDNNDIKKNQISDVQEINI